MPNDMCHFLVSTELQSVGRRNNEKKELWCSCSHISFFKLLCHFGQKWARHERENVYAAEFLKESLSRSFELIAGLWKWITTWTSMDYSGPREKTKKPKVPKKFWIQLKQR